MKLFFNKIKLIAFFKSTCGFAIVVLLLTSSGYAFANKAGSAVSMISSLMAFAVSIVLLFFRIRVPKEATLSTTKNKDRAILFLKHPIIPVIVLVAFFAIFVLLVLRSSNSIQTLIHYIILAITGLFLASSVTFDEGSRFFRKTIDVICIFSTAIFLFSLVSQKIPYTSVFSNESGITYYDFFHVFFTLKNNPYRNCGPFWEPGVFATFICIALLLEAVFQKKPNVLRIIIYAVTLLTTRSTAGYILALLPIVLRFAVERKYKAALLIVCLLALAVLTIVLVSKTPLGAFLPSSLSKIDTSSFGTRIRSYYYDFLIFYKSRFVGAGPNATDLAFESFIAKDPLCDSQTATFAWLLASFGFFGLVFVAVFFVSLFLWCSKKYNLMVALLVCVFAFLTGSKEPQYSFSLFWVVLFLPYFEYHRNISFAQTTAVPELVSKSNQNSKLMITRVSWNVIIKVVGLLVSMFSFRSTIAYFSNDAVLGVWSTILSVLTWILTFDFGIGSGLKNKIIGAMSLNDEALEKKYISSSYAVSTIISLFAFAVFFVASYFLDFNALLNVNSSDVSNKTIRLAFVLALASICLQFVLKNVSSLYEAIQLQPIATLASVITQTSLWAFVVLAPTASDGFGLVNISIFYIFAVNVPLLLMSIIIFQTRFKTARPNLKFIDKGSMRSVLRLGFGFFAIQIALLIINSSNQLLVSNIFGSSMVVEYQKYHKIFGAVCTFGSAVSMPLWALIGKAYVERQLKWIKKSVLLSLSAILVIVLGTALLGVILQPIFDLLYGESSIPVNPIIVLAFFFWVTFTVVNYFVSAYANGIEALKPQLIVLGLAAILKIPVIYLIKFLLNESFYWWMILIFDAVALGLCALVTAFACLRRIKKKEDKDGAI